MGAMAEKCMGDHAPINVALFRSLLLGSVAHMAMPLPRIDKRAAKRTFNFLSRQAGVHHGR